MSSSHFVHNKIPVKKNEIERRDFLFNALAKVTAPPKVLGLFCIRWSGALLHSGYASAEPKTREALMRTVARLYYAESSIAQSIWAHSQLPNNIFQLVRWTKNELDYHVERDLPEHYLVKGALYAMFCGTRAKAGADKFVSGLDVDILSDIHKLRAQDTAFLSLSSLITYISAWQPQQRNAILIDFFLNEVKDLTLGKYDKFGAGSDFDSLPDLHLASWKSPVFSPLRMKLMPNRGGWREVLSLELKEAGISEAQLAASTGDIGPSYNFVDEYGCPVPGAIRNVFIEPKAGLGRITGIGLVQGKLAISGTSASESEPAVIFDLDLLTAIGIVFSSDDPEFRFSLESWRSPELGHSFESILQEKAFHPGWLRATDFGRSVFFADYLLQQINSARVPAIQSLTEPHRTNDLSGIDEESREFFQALCIKGNDYVEKPLTYMGARQCIRNRDVQVALNRERTFANVVSNSSYIESSIIVRTADGQVDSNHRPNDPETKVGAAAITMMNSWGKLKKLYPAFARVEQLLLLHRLVVFAKQNGWRPDTASLRRADQLIKEATKLTEGSRRKERLFAPFPYHNFGCTCRGRWPEPVHADKEDLSWV